MSLNSKKYDDICFLLFLSALTFFLACMPWLFSTFWPISGAIFLLVLAGSSGMQGYYFVAQNSSDASLFFAGNILYSSLFLLLSGLCVIFSYEVACQSKGAKELQTNADNILESNSQPNPEESGNNIKDAAHNPEF